MFQTLLGDFAVTCNLNVYCNAPQAMPRLYDRLHPDILDVFDAEVDDLSAPRRVSDGG